MNKPTIGEVLVVREKDARHYSLRIYLSAKDGGTVMFETTPQFSKIEADYRAMLLSSRYGFTCGELPTHPDQMPYPKES